MIENLIILNFKSVREAMMSCRQLNILIGRPNTGKSNILEALGLFSLYNNECKITELARFQTMHNLFYEHQVHNPIHIRTNTHRIKIQLKENFEVYVETLTNNVVRSYELYYDQTGKLLNSHPHYVSPINLYRFSPADKFQGKGMNQLRPPHGENLVMMLIRNQQLRQLAADIYEPYGFRFVVNPQENTVHLQKETDGLLFSHPYTLASRMLQRFLFHMTAIETNKDGVIIFEEPESYASSELTYRIADAIAENRNNNQYFISTHNMKFLAAMLDRLPPEKVKVYVTYYENYQTKVKPLREEMYRDIVERDLNPLTHIEATIEETLDPEVRRKLEQDNSIE